MKTILVAVLDKKAEDFGGIFTTKNPAIAERDFSTACKQNENYQKYPEDYALYQMGLYDTTTGKIETIEKPILITEAIKYVIKEEKPNDKKIQTC